MCEASNKRGCACLWFGKRKHGPLRQSMCTAGTRIETVSEVLYVSNDGADSKRVKISGLSCEVLIFSKEGIWRENTKWVTLARYPKGKDVITPDG